MDNSKVQSDDEESDYSYVYETDSEFEDDDAIGETAEETGTIKLHPDVIFPEEIPPADVIATSNNQGDDVGEKKEDKTSAISKEQMEAMKPKLPAYITSPEPCAFSEDPCTWIAWMEDQVNKERERRMNKILCASPEAPEVKLDDVDPKAIEVNVMVDTNDAPEECLIVEINDAPEESIIVETNNASNLAMEEKSSDQVSENIDLNEDNSKLNVHEKNYPEDRSSIEIVEAPEEFEDCPLSQKDDESEWDYESDDDINEAETNDVDEQTNYDDESVQNELESTEKTITENNDTDDTAVSENAKECDKINEPNKIENVPSVETKQEIKDIEPPVYRKQKSCPAISNSSLVPDDIQRKLDFIRKKKASLGQSSNGENPHTPTNSSSILLLDEETQKKLAFIRQKKLSAGQNLENASNTAQDSNPRVLQRQTSNPEGAGRPQSMANDSSLDDMLSRIKLLREERKQILQDMSAIKNAFGTSPSKEYEAMISSTDDGIESGVNTPNSELINSFHADHEVSGKDSPLIPGALLSRQSRRSFDSGIGSKSLCSIQDGSPTAELETGKSASSTISVNDGQTKRKISRDKCIEEGVTFCFICGENMGKLSKGAIMHMGLEDGDPVCADALYLTEESKEKIRQIATTKTFSYEDKFSMLDTLDLETWNIEYEIPSSDVIDKVDAFLIDVEQQKARDREKFDAMRSGAIDDIFNEEFGELLNNRHVRDNQHAHDNLVLDNHEELHCDAKNNDDRVTAPAHDNDCGAQPPPPPPLPPATTTRSSSSPINIPNSSTALSASVLDSIKQGSPHLKHTETLDKSEIKLGQVIHRHLAPVVFNRDVRSLVRDIAKESKPPGFS